MSIAGIFFEPRHLEMHAKARNFTETMLKPAAAEIDRTGKFPKELGDEMARLGFFGIKIPKEYGGFGGDTRTYVGVMEEVARGAAVAATYMAGGNSLGSAPLLLSGTEEQKHFFLPGVADNTGYTAFALTEPNAGSDAGGMTTMAVEDGDCYVLNGRKCFITCADIAKYCVVFAKTNPEKGSKGITTFIVDMDAPGLTLGNHERKMGQLGLSCCDVVMEDVRVPKSRIVGEVDRGFITAMKTLSVGRVGVAAQSIGVAQAAIEEAIKYVKTHYRENGKPLATSQAVQFELADMETKLNAARLLVYNAACVLDEGKDATKAASMAKLYATETSVEVVSRALQLHGEFGYSKDSVVERLHRDIRVLTLYEGTSQVQQMVISGQMLK